MKLHEFHGFIRLSHYVSEYIATFLFVFAGIFSLVFWLGMPFAKTLVPAEHIRVIFVILSFALGILGLSYSVFGKVSGAHLNPAVSFAFYLEGHMNFFDFLGYALGQFLGALSACFLVFKLMPEASSVVHLGSVHSAPDMPAFLVFSAEAFSITLILLCVFYCLHHERIVKWTGLISAVLVFWLVYFTAHLTGASMNPARAFAPAYFMHNFHHLWIYLSAPFVGAIIAVGIARYGEYLKAHRVWEKFLFWLKRPQFFRFYHEEGYVEKLFERYIQKHKHKSH
jgi:aquaporin Z